MVKRTKIQFPKTYPPEHTAAHTSSTPDPGNLASLLTSTGRRHTHGIHM